MNKIRPYLPTPYRDGCKIIKTYTLPFEDSVGNKADITYIDYTDKKGKLHEAHIMYVKWR